MTPSIRLDLESLRVSKRGTVTGVLCFMLDGGAFPDPLWNDFVGVVLSWWCRALLGPGGDLLFMDGPFSVRLKFRGADDTELVFCRSGRCIDSAMMRRNDLRQQILVASKAVLSFCDHHGVRSADVDALRAAIHALELTN